VVAEQAALGAGGAAQVKGTQNFFRSVFELTGDQEWPDNPVGPSATHWRGVGVSRVLNSPTLGTCLDPLIEERLWPNKKYSWLSGILQHRPNRVAAPSQLVYWVDYNPNPNAAVAAPDTVMRALTGEEGFHAMWQRPRRR
jgi:hypothetical protein